MKKLFLFLCIFSSIFVISCGTKKDNIEVQFKINNNESFDLENFVIFLSDDKSITTVSTTVEANSSKNISLNSYVEQAIEMQVAKDAVAL